MKKIVIRCLVLIALCGFIAQPVIAKSIPTEKDNSTTLKNATDIGLPWSNSDIDSLTGEASEISIAMDGNTPWIAYFVSSTKNLKVAHYVGSNGNCGPNADWECTLVASIGDIGNHPSIAIYKGVTGMPDTWKVGVSYIGDSLGYVYYAEYSCVITTCSWTKKSIASHATMASLAYDSTGTAKIAYHAIKTGEGWLEVASPSLPAGANCDLDATWLCDTVDGTYGVDVGMYPSIDVNKNDNIMIAYYDSSNTRLKLAWYFAGGNCSSSGDWKCEVIDSGNDVGQFTKLYAAKTFDATDHIWVAYYDATDGKLRWASPYTGGNCGWASNFVCGDIDTMGTGVTKPSISLAVDSQHSPVIAYISPVRTSVTDLKIASPSTYGGGWQSTTVTRYGSSTAILSPAIGIDSAGHYAIAYGYTSMLVSPPGYWLSFTIQHNITFLPVITN